MEIDKTALHKRKMFQRALLGQNEKKGANRLLLNFIYNNDFFSPLLQILRPKN